MKRIVITLCFLATIYCGYAQNTGILNAPEVKEGEGPYPQLIIRGITLIDGTGAPPVGPVDIVVRQTE